MKPFFTARDEANLRGVAASLQQDNGALTRANTSGYQAVGAIDCQMMPPGYSKEMERNVAPHLRGQPLGTVKVMAGADVRAKDRLAVGGRLFEVVAPLEGRTFELRRKFIVREVHQPERELYLALAPVGFDGAGSVEAEPELVRVLPVPFITDKPVEMVDTDEQVARLKQIEVAEISRAAFSDTNLARLMYCLVVMSDVTVTAADAMQIGADAVYTRYRFNGPPVFEAHHWASDYPYSVGLVEGGR